MNMVVLFFILAITLTTPFPTQAADSYTLTTYYPAPNGKYDNLTTNNFICNGNVGIGTISVHDLIVDTSSKLGGNNTSVTSAFNVAPTATASVLTVDAGGINIMGNPINLTSPGLITIGGNTKITGDTTMKSDASIEGTATIPRINGGTTINGTTEISPGHDLIVAGGNVGIGAAATPAYSLDVIGTSHINGAATFDSGVVITGDTGIKGKLTINGGTATITPTGAATFSAMSATGNVGVGNTLDINGIDISRETATDLLYFTGGIDADAVFSRSDERLKDNIVPITDAVAKVKALNGVSFNFKKNPGKKIGLIAQNVEKVVPEVVMTGADGMKSVEYANLVGLLIEAIKEQERKIEGLQKAVEKLEGKSEAVKPSL